MPTAERKPWVAGIMSVLAPGLGHLYVGRWELGVCWYATILLLILAFGLIVRSPLLPSIINVGGLLIPLVGYFFVTQSAVRHARNVRHTYSLKVYNRWYVYLGLLVVGGIISSLLGDAGKEFVVQPYKIPAGSMIPTLLTGDHIYVDKLIYRAGERPQRGDIIVFKFPEDETKDFVKRIVGIPGDAIEIRNKQVILNGAPIDDHDYTQRIDPRIIDRLGNPRDNFGPITVPDNSYFVLGDNRDQSLDSRFWGYVEASKIKGKATVIYWSWSGLGERSVMEERSDWVRWGRIGQRIQ